MSNPIKVVVVVDIRNLPLKFGLQVIAEIFFVVDVLNVDVVIIVPVVVVFVVVVAVVVKDVYFS